MDRGIIASTLVPLADFMLLCLRMRLGKLADVNFWKTWGRNRHW